MKKAMYPLVLDHLEHLLPKGRQYRHLRQGMRVVLWLIVVLLMVGPALAHISR